MDVKVSEDDVISDSTQKAHRSLLAAAFIVISVKLLDIPVKNVTFLGVQSSERALDKIDFIMSIILIYLLYNLIFHWVRDVSSWKKWHGEASISSLVGKEVTVTEGI